MKVKGTSTRSYHPRRKTGPNGWYITFRGMYHSISYICQIGPFKTEERAIIAQKTNFRLDPPIFQDTSNPEPMPD